MLTLRSGLLLLGQAAVCIVATSEYGDKPVGLLKDSSFDKLPECSQSCFKHTLDTDGCDYNDTACHCTKTSAFDESFSSCVVQACTASEQQVYLTALLKVCSSIGASATKTTRSTHTGFAALDWSFKLPHCSKKCYDEAKKDDGCDLEDAACHCTKDKAFADNFETCVKKDCSVQCQVKYSADLKQECDKLGVPTKALPVSKPIGFPPKGSKDCPTDPYPAVPKCAEACFNNIIETDGCCKDDAACHCSKSEHFANNFNTCVVKDCPHRKDQKAYINALEASCASVCALPPKGAHINLPPLPSATRKVKPYNHKIGPRDVDEEYGFYTTLDAAATGVVSAILGGLGPVVNVTGVSNITAVAPNPTGTLNATNLTTAEPTFTANTAASTSATGTESNVTTAGVSSSVSSGVADLIRGGNSVVVEAVMAVVGLLAMI